MERKIKRLQEPRNGIQYIIYPETREELNPFAFFDAGTMTRNDEGLFIGMHPHSGIGIITYFEGADLKHDDSGNNDNIIPSGGVQWIRAGGGVKHQENYLKPQNTATQWSMTLHQLWMQLPPELEESEVEYQNFNPEKIPSHKNVKVIVGEYNGVKSPVSVPYNMTYLDVVLEKGDSFEFQSPDGQTTGFIFPREGEAYLYDEVLPLNHLSVLENNNGLLNITVNSLSKFVVLLAEPQNYPIITKGGSIHTNKESMQRSMERIRNTH